jgi:phage-related protein
VLAGQASAAQDTFRGKLEAVQARITDAVSQFGQKYGPAIQGVGVAVLALGSIWEMVGPVMALMSSLSLGPILLVAVAVAALIAVVVLLWKNWDTIWSAIQTSISAVWDWIASHWPLLLAILLGPIGIAVDLILRYWDQIKAGAQLVIAFVEGVWNGLVGFFAAIPGRVAGFFQAIWDGIRSGALTVIGQVQSFWDGLVSWFSGLPARIASMASGMWDGILGAFRSVINGVIDLWNRLHFTLPHVDLGPLGTIGGGDIGVPQIPHLASGGLITRDGLVYAHAGEAITPYAAGPAVHVENANFGQEVDVDVFMRRVAWVMQTRTA